VVAEKDHGNRFTATFWLAWFCACAESCVVFNTGPYTVLPDNSILITANMQLETGFPSSRQLKSYVASKSRLKLGARALLSVDAGLLVLHHRVVFRGSTAICCLWMSVASATRREMDWVMQRCETYRNTTAAVSIAVDCALELQNLPQDCAVLDITRLLHGILTSWYDSNYGTEMMQVTPLRRTLASSP